MNYQWEDTLISTWCPGFLSKLRGCGPGGFLLLLALSSTAYSQPAGSEERDGRLEAFLLDDTPAAFKMLADEPELFSERAVQVKVYRSLRGKDPEVLKAAYQLCLQVPDLTTVAPMIGRRCDGAFIGPDLVPKRLLLEFALEDADLTRDLRVVGLINSALHSEDAALGDLGRQVVARYPKLEGEPAILEAGPKGQESLPDYASFKTAVDPVFTTSGTDERACVSCHNSRPVLFLPHAGPGEDEAEMQLQRYRSTLLVINLDNPEESLILDKPTRPEPEQAHAAAGPEHHPGGQRFQKGDETYLRILQWIQNAGQKANR